MAKSQQKSLENLGHAHQLQVGFVRFGGPQMTGSTANGRFPSGSQGVVGPLNVTSSLGVQYVQRHSSGTYKVVLNDSWAGVGAITPSWHFSGVLATPGAEAGGAQLQFRPSGSKHTLRAVVPGNWNVTETTGVLGSNFFYVQLMATSGSTEVGSIVRPGDIVDPHEPSAFDHVDVTFFLRNARP